MFTIKNFLSSLLFIALLLSHFCYYPLFLYKQYCIEKEVKKNICKTIPIQYLSKFYINDAHLNWENESEFDYDDIMYDVVKIDTIYKLIFALPDNIETENLLKFYNTQSQENDKHESKYAKFKIHYPTLQIDEHIAYHFTNNQVAVTKHHYFYFNVYCKGFKQLNVPPPLI